MMNIIKLIYMYLSIHVPYYKLDVSYVFAVYKIDANLKQQELSLLQHNRGIIFYDDIIFMMFYAFIVI